MTDNRKRDKNGNLIDYSLPITTYEDYMKNVDYMTLGIITYYSKWQNEMNDYDCKDLFRYIYENDLREKSEEIEKISKTKFMTTLKNVRKLAKMDGDLIVARNTPNGIIYCINFYTSPHGYYTCIHHKVLKFLLDGTNSNVIKIYCYLKYKCKNGEMKITRKELADAIGLSPNSTNNLDTISNITSLLESVKLINKKYKSEQGVTDDCKFTTRKYCYYSLVDEIDWVENLSKEKSKEKGK